MDLVHPVYVSTLNTYPLLVGKDLLNCFEPLIDFKHLKIWTQVREPLPCQSLDSNESQCQVTDTAPKSLIDDAVAKPGSGPSTNSKDQEPLLCSLQEPESNAGPLRIMTAIDVQGISVSDTALALWAENSAISLKLFRTLKQRHQSLPHVAKHSRFPLSPWSTNMTTSKIICALDIRWNNRHLSHYFLIVPDLPHDIYIGADIMVQLNACIDTVNFIIWTPLSHQLTTSVNLKNLQSGQTMPDTCAMITEQEATIPAYSKSVSVHLNMRAGQTLNSKLSFFQPSRTCLKLGLNLEATPLIEVSSRAVYVLFNNCMAQDIHVPKAVPWLWTNGTCHRPHTGPTNVRRMQRHHKIHKTSWNHHHHLNYAGVQRKRLPFRTNRWHSPRCLRCLNTACNRITYTGDHWGPKPLKWLNCRGTLRRILCTNSTDPEWGGCPPQWSGSARTQRGSAQVQGLLRKGFPG